MNNKENNPLNTIMIRKLIKSLNQKFNSVTKKKNSKEKNKTGSDKSNIKWTDKGMFWVNIVLTLGTFLLFREATHQSGISQQAANASTIAARESINAFNLAKIAADSTDSFNVRNFKLQSKSINAQIQSLKEAKIELNKENRPLAQITDLIISDTIKVGNPIKLSYRITDFGRFPAKILTIKGYAWTDTIDNINLVKTVKKKLPLKIMNHYIYNQAYIPGNLSGIGTFTKSEYDEFVSGERSIYFFGEMAYSGLLIMMFLLISLLSKLGFIIIILMYLLKKIAIALL